MDLFDGNGKKIGYTDKNGKTVLFSNNQSTSTSSGQKKTYESKSHAELQTVIPKADQKKFDPFHTIWAWKTTKRFGLISVNARKQLDQKNLDGSHVKDGFEKWVIKLKTATDSQTIFGMYSVRKGCLFFDMGTTKCCVNHKKGFFSFIQPDFVTNKNKRK
ncbi:hypothetical protein [Flavobacterium undicola]|uniref:hypothetical protein n=1 Tax=Flavobacterium undicola TaxID=1932779 RepID=UPI001376F067|nr:hypothetical protein [Flavobacterium undicola]MBA0883802.1 hypothetical protein [Flavobacterium undicola]